MKPISSVVRLAIIVCSLAISGRLAADTISFPKENPAFTVASKKASIEANGNLDIDGVRIFELKREHGMDEEKIRQTIELWVSATMSARLRPAERPTIKPTKMKVAGGLTGYVTEGAVKSQPSFDHPSGGGAPYTFSAAVFQTSDGRYFYADSYEALGGGDLLSALDSLKPITK